MSAQYVNLDWRQAPSSSDTVNAIERFLTDLDANSKARITLSETRGKSHVGLVGTQPPMVLRRDVTTLRKYKGQVLYWARIYSMAVTISELLMQKQQVMARFIEYKEVSPSTHMTMAVARRALYDLALTLRVHPLALGVIPESTAQVTMPESAIISTTMITDIIKYHGADSKAQKSFEKPMGFEAGLTRDIPPLIKELRVSAVRNKGPLRGVVVVEHRNLKKILTDNDFKVADVILTSGYPSGATKEFLHMLSKDKRMARLPFLYLSDHDFQGFQIFQTLKYGATASAWASAIQICPRLTWVGPSKKDLLESPAAYLEAHKSQYKSDRPHESEDEVVRAIRAWQKQKTSSIQRKFVAATKMDRALYRGFERLGWLEHEPELKQEIQQMLETPSKFRLADLSQVSARYIGVFLNAKVVELGQLQAQVPVLAPVVAPLVMRSPIGERFKNLPSQVSSLRVEPSSELGVERIAVVLEEDLL